MFVQPLKVIDVGCEVTEEDGNLKGIFHVGVSDVESVEGCGGNAACIEDFIATCLRVQRQLKGV